jgi:hypothetical protein
MRHLTESSPAGRYEVDTADGERLVAIICGDHTVMVGRGLLSGSTAPTLRCDGRIRSALLFSFVLGSPGCVLWPSDPAGFFETAALSARVIKIRCVGQE